MQNLKNQNTGSQEEKKQTNKQNTAYWSSVLLPASRCWMGWRRKSWPCGYSCRVGNGGVTISIDCQQSELRTACILLYIRDWKEIFKITSSVLLKPYEGSEDYSTSHHHTSLSCFQVNLSIHVWWQPFSRTKLIIWNCKQPTKTPHTQSKRIFRRK